MGNPFNAKGSTIKIGVGAYDIKAVVIEDFDINVGEGATENIEASDGTRYTFVGAEAQSDVEFKVLLTDDAVDDILTAVYGAGGTFSGTGTEWSMINAGGTVNDITITSPNTSSNVGLVFIGVNGKGLVVKPTHKLQKGYEASVKFVVDYWKARRTTA